MTGAKANGLSRLIGRIFFVQTVLVVLAGILLLYAEEIGLGVFWMAFFAGAVGASLSLLRRAQLGDPLLGDALLAEATLKSWGTTLMPFLYGGMMAAVVYVLFLSGIVSGQEGSGLLATNLFPDFQSDELQPGVNSVSSFLSTSPRKVSDIGKLIVWCFMAGYSESFVTGLLRRLETSGKGPGADDD